MWRHIKKVDVICNGIACIYSAILFLRYSWRNFLSAVYWIISLEQEQTSQINMLKRQFDFSKTLILLIWASHLCPVKGWKLIFWYVVAWDISSLKWYIMFDWILINDLGWTASRRHFHHFWRQNTATELQWE